MNELWDVVFWIVIAAGVLFSLGGMLYFALSDPARKIKPPPTNWYDESAQPVWKWESKTKTTYRKPRKGKSNLP